MSWFGLDDKSLRLAELSPDATSLGPDLVLDAGNVVWVAGLAATPTHYLSSYFDASQSLAVLIDRTGLVLHTPERLVFRGAAPLQVAPLPDGSFVLAGSLGVPGRLLQHVLMSGKAQPPLGPVPSYLGNEADYAAVDTGTGAVRVQAQEITSAGAVYSVPVDVDAQSYGAIEPLGTLSMWGGGPIATATAHRRIAVAWPVSIPLSPIVMRVIQHCQ